MSQVLYFHWHEGEARDCGRMLETFGHKVVVHSATATTPKLNNRLPDAVVISLGRLPSHGRAVAGWFWEAKSRRGIPVIFAGGSADKIAVARRQFPTATFCAPEEIVGVLCRLTACPAAAARVGRPSTSGYSGKPLAVKLGLKAKQRVGTDQAPAELMEWLGPLPGNVTVGHRPCANTDLAIVFATDAHRLASRFASWASKMAIGGMLWVAWPKKAAKVATNLTEDVVREIGLAEGWVDVKVCAISEVWSGLKFLRRRTKC